MSLFCRALRPRRDVTSLAFSVLAFSRTTCFNPVYDAVLGRGDTDRGAIWTTALQAIISRMTGVPGAAVLAKAILHTSPGSRAPRKVSSTLEIRLQRTKMADTAAVVWIVV